LLTQPKDIAMPDPIQPNSCRSLTPQDLSCNGSDEPPPDPRCGFEPTLDPASSSHDDTVSSEHVLELMKSYPATSAAARSASSVGDSNADRVSQTPLERGYAASGVTGNGSTYGTLALAYGSDGAGYAYELGSASAQIGPQSEAQIAAWRSTYKNGAGDSITVELLSAQASGGSHNKDGSTGFNTGASVATASLELNERLGGSSATLGISNGPSLELSAGTRDIDGDGALEWCLRAGVGVTVGVCVEERSGWRR
jgi:hypothetical protein